MSKPQIILTTPEELKEIINGILLPQYEAIRKTLSNSDPEEIFNTEQAAKFLGVDASTLWHWRQQGKIPVYGIASKRFYKKSELLSCLTLLKK
jgi:hypothetical protein